MKKVSARQFWAACKGKVPVSPRQEQRKVARRRFDVAKLRQYREHPCVHIDLDKPDESHLCNCGITYPCEIHGRCVISHRSDLKFKSCLHCSDYKEKIVTSAGFGEVKRSEELAWAVGVTTAPRPMTGHRFEGMAHQRGWPVGNALSWTLESLLAAGFDEAIIFAEPGTPTVELSSSYSWVERSEQYGGWRNWEATARDLLMLHPSADAFLIVQDDVIHCRGLRAFLDATLWPDDAGVVSLYCSGRVDDRTKRPVYATGRGLQCAVPGTPGSGFWGACSLVFSREQLEVFLASNPGRPFPKARKDWDSPNLIDNRVGRWCAESRRKLWVYTPSLAQHVGEFRSALGHGGGGGLSASDFVGEQFDARTLIKNATSPVVLPVIVAPPQQEPQLVA